MNRPKTRLQRIALREMQLVGWRVEFSIHRKRVCRFFSDQSFGGRAEARSAAEEFLAKEAQYIEEVLQLMRRLYPRANTKFGMPGITRVLRSDGSLYWAAYWDDQEGCKIQRKFSINVLGEEKARKLAEKARLRAVATYMARLKKLKKILKITD